jgi:hypothetical protein
MNFKISGTIMAAALAAALAAAAPATAAPRGGHSGGHISSGGGGGGALGGRGFAAAGMNRGGMAVNPGAGRSVGLAPSRPNFAGANYAANRSGNGNWSNHSGNWSGNNWRGDHHRGHGGFGVGFAAGALIGSAPYYYGDGYGYDDYAYADGYDDSYVAAPSYAGDGDDASCAQLYRSYDPRSGTYLGYDGLRHPCP